LRRFADSKSGIPSVLARNKDVAIVTMLRRRCGAFAQNRATRLLDCGGRFARTIGIKRRKRNSKLHLTIQRAKTGVEGLYTRELKLGVNDVELDAWVARGTDTGSPLAQSRRYCRHHYRALTEVPSYAHSSADRSWRSPSGRTTWRGPLPAAPCRMSGHYHNQPTAPRIRSDCGPVGLLS
jgi:hypothetical protein